MKLLAKYNRINSLATILVLLAGGLCYYFVVRYILINQLDNDLQIEEQEIRDYVTQNGRLPATANYKDQKIQFEAAGRLLNLPAAEVFSSIDSAAATSRQLIFFINVAGENYKVAVIKSQAETEDLIQLIVIVTLAIVALLLVVLFIINRFILGKLWHPFYHTLSELKQFNVNNKTTIETGNSNVDEFKELDSAVLEMSSRVLKDYNALKSFTENASHEMQTPLAVIQSKLDVLIQDKQLSEAQGSAAGEAYEAIQKLNKLNQSLLLLTKIENNQFAEAVPVNLNEKMEAKIKQFKELWLNKNITISCLAEDAFITIHPLLADILLNNLLSNATKHNVTNGMIDIHLRQGILTITNTGEQRSLDRTRLFMRFYKDCTGHESHGLGLSIIKEISNVTGCTIDYAFEEKDRHSFTVRW